MTPSSPIPTPNRPRSQGDAARPSTVDIDLDALGRESADPLAEDLRLFDALPAMLQQAAQALAADPSGGWRTQPAVHFVGGRGARGAGGFSGDGTRW